MASAQTVILPPTLEEGKAAGYPALWDDYDKFGYILPQGYTVVDDAYIKVTLDNGSASPQPGAIVAVGSGINTTNTKYFDRAFWMGSAADDESFDAIYNLNVLSEGIKQPYAIFNVTAKEGGKLDMYFNRGDNKFTVYVWDKTAKEETGTYVLSNTTHLSGFGKEIISKATVGLMKDHEYYIFSSRNNANANMYEMVFTPYSADDYSITSLDASKYSTTIFPPMTSEEAQAAGYPGAWDSYDLGYVIPDGTVVADTEDLTAVVNNGSSVHPGNMVLTNLNFGDFHSSFCMGSAAGEEGFDPVYSLSYVSDGIKASYTIFEITAKKGGELTMLTNRSNKKVTMYVWDKTAKEEAGTYVLANTVHPSDKNLVTPATVDLMKDHTYWIFSSNNGANTNMFAMGFNSYDAPYYGYAGVVSSGIADITVDAAPQSNVIYNFQGQIVDENYKGFVIKNGKKYLQK